MSAKTSSERETFVLSVEHDDRNWDVELVLLQNLERIGREVPKQSVGCWSSFVSEPMLMQDRGWRPSKEKRRGRNTDESKGRS